MVSITSNNYSLDLEYLDYLDQVVKSSSPLTQAFLDLRVQKSLQQQGLLTSKGVSSFTTIKDQGVGIRGVYRFAKVFESHNLCEDLPSAVNQVLRKAVTLNENAKQVTKPYTLSYARKGFKRSDPPYTSPHPFDEGFRELSELIAQHQDAFNGQLKVKFNRQTSQTSYVSSDEISYQRNELEWTLLFHFNHHGMMFYEPLSFNGDNLKLNFPLIEQTVEKLRQILLKLPSLKKPRVTKLPLVASPESAWTFIHETIVHGV